jgi:hypothetical protein
MDRRTFWSSKSPLPEYQAITFSHPSFESPIRLVADKFESVTLAGNVHQPAPMTVKPPDQRGDSQPKLVLSFPRAVVGRDFKRAIAGIQGADVVEPITVTYDLYLGDTAAPEVSWTLYISDVGGIVFSPDAVQVTATESNPMRLNVSEIYDPAVFTGLELI